MTATILDGKALAASIKGELATRVAALKGKGISPGLGTVLVGDDPGSVSYVAGKHRDCQEVGINSIRVDLKADAAAEQSAQAGKTRARDSERAANSPDKSGEGRNAKGDGRQVE